MNNLVISCVVLAACAVDPGASDDSAGGAADSAGGKADNGHTVTAGVPIGAYDLIVDAKVVPGGPVHLYKHITLAPDGTYTASRCVQLPAAPCSTETGAWIAGVAGYSTQLEPDGATGGDPIMFFDHGLYTLYQPEAGITFDLALDGGGPELELELGTFDVTGAGTSYHFDTSTWQPSSECLVHFAITGGPSDYEVTYIWGRGQTAQIAAHRTSATGFAGSTSFAGYETVARTQSSVSFAIDANTGATTFVLDVAASGSTIAGPAGGINGSIRYDTRCTGTF